MICPHPARQGLFFATGGSFHAWKFLPILGELVFEMMTGTLDDGLAAKWAWDRKMPAHDGAGLWPRREWSHLVEESASQGGGSGDDDHDHDDDPQPQPCNDGA